jgi:3-oxoadipate enol-lactonase
MPVMNINGNNLYYETYGNTDAKETMMFMNGVMTSTSSWAYYLPVFEKLGYHIVLHDFKGQLNSDKPEGPYTFKEHADDAKQLLEALGVHKVHLIGTSYGGEVALQFAIDNPESVSSLILIDAASEIDETSRLFVEGWKYLAESQQGEAFFWGAVPSLYGNAFISKNKEFLAERARRMNEIDPSYFYGQVNLYDTYLKDLHLTRCLPAIKCPTLVIFGENDALTPRKFSDILAKQIPTTEYMIFPESGHVTIFEQPETLKTALIGFILKHS